jgi:PiT family inorganic phosphate transporter
VYAGIVLVTALALGFAYTNGFHDSANAIATSISTRALTPRAALLMAAVMNLIGAFIGTGVAQTITKGLITAPSGKAGLVVVGSALVGAIVWNLITWYFGLPSSSSHALIGGLVGAALISGAGVIWYGVVTKVVLPMVLSPVVGFLVGGLVMIAVLWIFRRARPARVTRGFRMAQTLSAAAMALGHGLQDTQKTIGVVVLVLLVTGHQHGSDIPIWVIVTTALTMSLGTYAGGWRIMRTLGRRVIELDPPHGFAAELTASSVLYISSYVFNAPISTTHVMSAAIMGVGSTKRRSAVRWNVAGNIVVAWVLTMPAAAIVAAIIWELGHLIIQ